MAKRSNDGPVSTSDGRGGWVSWRTVARTTVDGLAIC
jgi:hypothetical protein